jgi:hypothetical protein
MRTSPTNGNNHGWVDSFATQSLDSPRTETTQKVYFNKFHNVNGLILRCQFRCKTFTFMSIYIDNQTLRKPVVLRPSFLRQIHHPVYFPHCACARRFFSVRIGAVVSQDHSAVSVSTLRLGVQFRRPKAVSPPQELEVRAAGGRANF